ncbi:MAG: methylated-DNA--[protein]-cysteine S-methyltransferase [Steroidobacteraceae bacterium]
MTDPHFCNAMTFASIARALAVVAQQPAALPTRSHLATIAGLSLGRLRRQFLDWSGVELDLLLEACAVIGDEEELVGEARLFAAAHALQLRGQDLLRHSVVDLRAQQADAGRWRGVLRWGYSPSPFGDCVLAWTELGLCHLEFFDEGSDSIRLLKARWCAAEFEREDAVAVKTARAVFGGQGIDLHLIGSAFQLEVWRALVARDSGETVTYGELAAAISRPRASRAVGTAVGSNRIGWLVPCHHVVRADGGLGGFHWGVDRKRAMLIWESLRPA